MSSSYGTASGSVGEVTEAGGLSHEHSELERKSHLFREDLIGSVMLQDQIVLKGLPPEAKSTCITHSTSLLLPYCISGS